MCNNPHILNMASSYPIYSLTLQDLLFSFCSKSTNKRVDIDSVLPFLILPLLLSTATFSLTFTIIVMVVILMGVLYVCSRPKQKNRSRFFFSWTLSSCICMFLVFESILLHMWKITQLEHFAFLIPVICTAYFFNKMKATADFELVPRQYSPVLTSDSGYCQICQIEVNERYFHSIWWDCCILRPNYGYYLAGQVFALISLLYGTNLGLTSVCFPVYYGNVLMPNDCTLAYSDIYMSATFVACVYGLGYVLVILLVLIRQLFLYIPRYLKWSVSKKN